MERVRRFRTRALLALALVGACGSGTGSQSIPDSVQLVDGGSDVSSLDASAEDIAAGDIDASGADPDTQEDAGCGSCDDLNPCTIDTCLDGGCEHAAVAAATSCDDGRACTSGDQCDSSGVCSGTAITCSTTQPCSLATCVEDEGGCVVSADVDGNPCGGGVSCVTEGVCVDGTCVGESADCDDGMACTSDGCEAGACRHDPVAVGTSCDDGDACTTGDACAATGECVGSPVDCSTTQPCMVGSCNAAEGSCVSSVAADGAACDDGELCTALDACTDSVCVGVGVECVDDDACTAFECEPSTGLCSGVPDPDVTCDDGNACTVDWCDALEGCQVESFAASCDDRNGCTSDSCDTEIGCVFAPIDSAECKGSCCTAHATPSCASASCGACVCQLDGACCLGAWDEYCAELAHENCGATCGCGCGDGICGGTETCADCEEDCGSCPVVGPDGEGCCEAKDAGKCPTNLGCEACVCTLEPTCCSDEWTSACAALASSVFCGAECGDCACGNDVCEPFEHCSTCPGDCGSCAATACCSSTTCADLGCVQCACEIDASCCTGWGAQCTALTSSSQCAAACGCKCGDGMCDPAADTCANCPADCGDCAGDCCEAKAGPGCNSSTCMACVCDAAPDCCNSEWGPSCVNLAEFVCPFDCACGTP